MMLATDSPVIPSPPKLASSNVANICAFLDAEIKIAKDDMMAAQIPANRTEALHRLEALQRVKRFVMSSVDDDSCRSDNSAASQ